MSSSTVISRAQHRQYIAQGYTAIPKGNHVCFGAVYTKTEYEKQNVTGYFNKLLVAITANHSGLVRNLELTKKYMDLDYQKLGFHPDDPESIKKYIEDHKDSLIHSLGHKFLPYHRPETGLSCIIFLPYGNVNEAKVVAMWRTSTGLPYNTLELIEAGHKQCATYRGNVTPKGHRAIIMCENGPGFSIVKGVRYEKKNL